MARIRNTKQLGQRVDRTYLRKLYAIPRWRRILTLLFVTAGLVWLGIYAIARNQTPYTAGALTPSHAFPGNRCAACHGASAGIGGKVADQQCLKCHYGPTHQASQTFTPACVACHVEHRGKRQLAGAKDSACVSCHRDLRRKDGKPTATANVASLRSHPEFAAVTGGRDAAGLRFDHRKHVGELSQECGDCHVPAEASALMSLPTYAGSCQSCHPLPVDTRIAVAAPHDKPDVVHKFVVEQLTRYIAAHPANMGTEGTPRSAAAWVQFKVTSDEKKLLEETCARCHNLRAAAGFASATVVPAHLATRWFSKASFDHNPHRGFTCATCHPNGTTSKVSSDVLVPGIAICRQCHASGASGARANCSTCHVYHDWPGK
jgi:hypothetical protein